MANIVPAADAFAAVRGALDTEAGLPADANSSLNNWIQEKLSRILTADSFESINAIAQETGLTPSKSLIGRTLEIKDFIIRESAAQFRQANGGKSELEKFCLVEAADTQTGETFIMDGGGDNFVAQMVRMRNLYDFPFTGTLLSTHTSNGYDLMYWRFHDPKRAPRTDA